MPRRREVPKQEILPDPKFGNVEIARFMNVLMLDGRKSVTERIIYSAFGQIEKKAGKTPVKVFTPVIGDIKPVAKVKGRRVGGANYQVPVEVRPSCRLALVIRWLRGATKKRSERSTALRLVDKLLGASGGRGGAMKERDEVHHMAEANKTSSRSRF